MERISALLIAGAYTGLCLLLTYMWARYRDRLRIHSPMWLPLILLFATTAVTNGVIAFELHLVYRDLWRITRALFAVISLAVFLCFVYMLPRVRASG